MTESTPQSSSGPMGQYYLLDKIAQGGMAEIYKGLAYDLHGIRRTVVIKKILPHIAAHREFIDMLVAEAKLAVQLSHGNIAQIYDLGKVGDDYFMVLEYVDGKTVSQIMRKAAQLGELLPIAVALHIAAETASGLNYMHSRADTRGRPLNIIHRDISPQNLMLTSGGTVKIIDFGIAKAATTIEITDAGVVKGKFAYMSPEQASGDPLDFRTDVFSLGVVAFEMLTGRRLFKGKDNQETLRNVRRANVPSPSSYRNEIPDELNTIILKSLSKSRDDRYRSAGEFRDDLVQFLHRFDPGFHHAAITDYLSRLFKDDEQESSSELSHTPLLIIDHTQSAILDPNDKGPEELPAVEAVSSGVGADEHSEWTPLLPAQKAQRQAWALAAIVALLIVTLSLGVGYWRYRVAGLATKVIASKQPLLGHATSSTTPVTVPRIPIPTTPPPPPAPFGDVVVTSEPAGAALYLDDKPTGDTTPVTLSHLPADHHHQVGLHLKGYKFWTSHVSIHAGGMERLNAILEIDYAELEIITTPLGADVEINEKQTGKTPYYDAKLRPEEVLKIVVRKEGYLEWKRELITEAGRHMTLHPILERDPRSGERPPHFTEPPSPPPTVLPKAPGL